MMITDFYLILVWLENQNETKQYFSFLTLKRTKIYFKSLMWHGHRLIKFENCQLAATIQWGTKLGEGKLGCQLGWVNLLLVHQCVHLFVCLSLSPCESIQSLNVLNFLILIQLNFSENFGGMFRFQSNIRFKFNFI